MVVWMISLILFALTYQLTGSEFAATVTVVILMVFAIQTTDVIGFMDIYTTGRHALFDLRALREIGLGLLLPMSLFALVSGLCEGKRGWLILIGLCCAALASVHPRALLAFMVFAIAVGLLLIVQRRVRLTPLIVSAGLVVLGGAGILAIVLLRTRLPQFLTAASTQTVCAIGDTSGSGFTLPLSLPLVSDTYLLSIGKVFAHFMYLLGFLGSVYLAVRYRKQKIGIFYAAPALIVGVLMIAPVVIRFAGIVLNLNTMIGDPCQLELPLVQNVLDNLIGAAQLSLLPLVFIAAAAVSLVRRSRWLRRAAPLAVAPVTLIFLTLTLFEPIPIPYSARDQLRTLDDLQAHLTVFAAHVHFADAVAARIDTTTAKRFLAANAIAGTLIEQVPNALVAMFASGAYQLPTERFFNIADPLTPFLDTADLQFLQAAHIDYIVVEVFNTRYPQLLLDTTHFELDYQAGGIALFRVRLTDVTIEDALFAEMNAALPPSVAQTWVASGIGAVPANLSIDTGTAERLRAAWEALPSSPLRDYGLAFISLFSPFPNLSVDQWRTLSAMTPVFVENLALAYAKDQQELLGVQVLVGSSRSRDVNVRLTAVRALFTERYFWRLSADELDTLLAIIHENQDEWRALTRFDPLDGLQSRIELLMSAGRWAAAAEMSTWIAPLELRADELSMRGLAVLAQGDVQGALDTLSVATDSDWLMSRLRLHTDRWENNTAAQMYFMLAGNAAERAGDTAGAAEDYRSAAADGAGWAGRAFLARVTGDDALMASVEHEWEAHYGTPFPALTPLIEIADTGRIYVNNTVISRADLETTIEVFVQFGSAFERLYPVHQWYTAVGSPSLTTIYAQLRETALLIPGALVTDTFSVQVPEDVPLLSPAVVGSHWSTIMR